MKVLFWRVKVAHCNFATSKPIKIHMNMKKFLFLVLLIIAIALPSIAQEASSHTSDRPVSLEVRQTKEATTHVHRAPIFINIEAYYSEESKTLEVCYDGEAMGETYLYLNNNIIEYNSEINSSFQISSPGIYEIEIIGDSWIATGYIQL